MSETELKPAAGLAAKRVPIFPGESDAYAAAREALLAEEIEARRHMTRLAEQRQALPPGPLVKAYRFRDETGAELALADLFDGHDTLISYFWMFGPERARPCPMCTNWLGGVNGNAADVEQRAALRIIGRSPVARQQAFAAERGWRGLRFVQTIGDDFATDLGLIDDNGDEWPGIFVFRKSEDGVRLFYAAEMPAEAADPGQDPRGPVDIAPLWNLLDITPEGRDPHWYPKLAY